MFGLGTHGGNRPVERDKFHITPDVRNQLAKGGCRQCWRRFRIVMMRMGSPEFSWFLRRIVATSMADVQRGVAHAVMGMNTRKLSRRGDTIFADHRDEGQIALAHRIGVSLSTLQRLEMAEQNVGLDTLETICVRLYCEIVELFPPLPTGRPK
jgi:DNA-binding Xre family transcriptional regulator